MGVAGTLDYIGLRRRFRGETLPKR